MKIFEGIVVSVNMHKTAVVEVSRRTPHPLYRKLIKRSKKYKVDSADFKVLVGNQVRIAETRPISKGKYFKIIKITGVTQVKKTAEKPVRKTAIANSTEKSTEKPVEKKVKKSVRSKAKKEANK